MLLPAWLLLWTVSLAACATAVKDPSLAFFFGFWLCLWIGALKLGRGALGCLLPLALTFLACCLSNCGAAGGLAVVSAAMLVGRGTSLVVLLLNLTGYYALLGLMAWKGELANPLPWAAGGSAVLVAVNFLVGWLKARGVFEKGVSRANLVAAVCLTVGIVAWCIWKGVHP